jgi:transcriptional regulator with XRE-family HTH domain
VIDRAGLAEYLRTRREALQPEDVGLPRGSRRRTTGLRREEVAALAHMSTDFYARLEQERGAQPSEQTIAAIGSALHLSLDERDHLFRLAGHNPPPRAPAGEQIGPGLLRIFERLEDTPAEIVTEVGETLRQTRIGVALTGDLTAYAGPARSLGYRWFTEPDARSRYAEENHAFMSRLFASGLRELAVLRGPGSRPARLAADLLERSEEFRQRWDDHEIGLRPDDVKHFVHPEVGRLELHCQRLVDPDHGHTLLVYTAAAGSVSAERLRLLSVVAALA